MVAFGAVVSLLLAVPGTSLAQEDGVTLDPDSAPGKEYAIPLESAREKSTDTDKPRGERKPESFGAGLGEKPPAPRAAPVTAQGTSSEAEAPEKKPAPATKKRRAPEREHTTTSEVAGAISDGRGGGSGSGDYADGGNSGLLALLGGAVAVLVLGGLGGVLLRRRDLPETSG